MKNPIKKLLLLSALTSTTALAQGSGSVGGGKFSEVQMKDFLGELSQYFSSSEYPALFPEVKEWEVSEKQKFSEFILTIEPKVVNHKVYGPFNEERDCVSKLDGAKRYFECDHSRIPENTLQNQPSLYMILLHEVMVHAKIETPSSETLPSRYPVSSRFGNTQNLSLVTYQKWVPGKAKKALATADQLGVLCMSETASIVRGKRKKALGFIWTPDGSYALFTHKIPYLQSQFGYQQHQVVNNAQYVKTKLVQNFVRSIARGVTTQIISTGKATLYAQYSYSDLQNDRESPYGNNKKTYLKMKFKFDLASFKPDQAGVPLQFAAEIGYGKGWYRHSKSMSCQSLYWWEYGSLPKVEELLSAKDGDVIRENVISKMTGPLPFKGSSKN